MANAFHAYMTLPGSLARLATGWSRPRLQPNHPSSETQGMVCQRVCPISQSCVVAARARQTCLVSLGNPEKQIGFQNPRRLDQKCHVPAISPCTASACRLHLGPGSTPLRSESVVVASSMYLPLITFFGAGRRSLLCSLVRAVILALQLYGSAHAPRLEESRVLLSISGPG